jgi:hypothetical protein
VTRDSVTVEETRTGVPSGCRRGGQRHVMTRMAITISSRDFPAFSGSVWLGCRGRPCDTGPRGRGRSPRPRSPWRRPGGATVCRRGPRAGPTVTTTSK